MGPFELQLRAFAEKAGANAELITRKVIIDIWAELIERSPVDTGRFRANWIYSLNAKASGTVETAGTTLAPSPAPGPPEIAPGAFGAVHFLTNNLPYAQRLETGHSNQAPSGLVGLTIIRWQEIVSKAAREVNP